MFKTFLQENQLIIPSYQYYGGLSGFQDYGILGFQIKNKLINIWREFFTSTDIHEVEIPTIMPYDILKASGHVDRFTDYVVYNKNGACFRADHLVKNWFKDNNMVSLADKVDSMDQNMLEEVINKYKMLDEGYAKVHKKNLMVEVPSNTLVQGENCDFLRPELAQGIFVNFSSYLSYTQTSDNFKPFGIAQIGKSYRKEISPQPFIRMREFTQAEIEYFVHPNEKYHVYYTNYDDTIIPIVTAEMQTDGQTDPQRISIEYAITHKLISHELMGYFLAKIYLFAKKIGLKDDKIRFRQHLPNEMAHYASQCWDLECLVNGSWLECVGCADRECYDLTAHGARNHNQPLVAKYKLPIAKTEKVLTIKPNAKLWKDDLAKYIDKAKKYLAAQNQEFLDAFVEELGYRGTIRICVCKDGEIFSPIHWGTDCQVIKECTKDMFIITEEEKTITHETFVPHVIEPSFGIDRLMYAVLEQNIWFREQDAKRAVLSVPDELCVYDVAVFPLHKKDKMFEMAMIIRNNLLRHKYKCYVDDSGTSIGKRYTRADEIGVKYAITVDPGSLETKMVTIRNRDTMEQIFVHYDKIIEHLQK